MPFDHFHIEPSWQSPLAAADLGSLEGLMRTQLGKCVSDHGRGQVIRIELAGGQVVFVKRDTFSPAMLKNALADLCHLKSPRDPATREVEAIRRVASLGVRTPLPLAWGHRKFGPFPLQSVLVTAELTGKHLHIMLKYGAPRDEVRSALSWSGRTAGAIYRAGLSWPDLMPKHFFIEEESAGVLDLIRVHQAKGPVATYMPAQVGRFCDKARFFGTEEEDLAFFLEAMDYEGLLKRTGVS